jgi:hypothetical protein
MSDNLQSDELTPSPSLKKDRGKGKLETTTFGLSKISLDKLHKEAI